MVDNPGYATLRMGLRPPRVAVIFDGGAQWHYWARLALYACTKLWGGEGFILIPHQGGQVRSELLAAARAYDPDYVVALQRTVRMVEQATPGELPLRDQDGILLKGERRDQFVQAYAEGLVESREDAAARKRVADICSPHRRRDEGDAWDEPVTVLSAEGDAFRLTKCADLFAGSEGACLSAPSGWGDALGVATAARCGAVEEPRLGGAHNLNESTLRQLILWLIALDGEFNAPPSELIWHPGLVFGFDPAQLDTAFARSRHGLVSIGRGFASRQNVVVVVGDAAEDFALAHAYRRVYGRGIWLPDAWLASGTAESIAMFGLRSTISKHVLRGGRVVVTTTSVDDSSVDAVLSGLRQPTFWSEGDQERLTQQFEERVVRGAIEWPTNGVQYSAVDGQFDQDYAIPINRNEAGDVEMVVVCPPPAINQLELAGSASLHWQVDVELIEAVSPRGRGLDGHAVLAEGQDPYLTWVRNGRDGIVYESERFNFIPAGASPVSRLARPRLRVPGLAGWADLMARQAGRRMGFSAAGRRVEVMRQLWGDRAALAGQFAGPMLSVLRAFRPTAKNSSLKLSESDGDILATGAGEHLWEAYLTFSGVLKYGGADEDSSRTFREQVDEMLKRGILRRGLVLGCELCGRPAFLVIDDLAQVNRCPRCSAVNNLSQARWRKPENEPQWYYDLHPTVREHLAQDGEIPLLLSHHLRSGSREYDDVAELELSDDNGPLAECDLVALRDGQLVTAEAKRTGSLGEGKKLRQTIAKRALLAEQLQADQILLATTDSKWQQTSVDALCQEIRRRPWTMPAPQVRLICGLGTATVIDLEADTETGLLSPWPKDRR